MLYGFSNTCFPFYSIRQFVCAALLILAMLASGAGASPPLPMGDGTEGRGPYGSQALTPTLSQREREARAPAGELRFELPANGNLRIENLRGAVIARVWQENYVSVAAVTDSGKP